MKKKSKTEQFFLKRFNKDNTYDAVEAAVKDIYQPYLKGFHDYYPIPIDVAGLAESLGVEVNYVDYLSLGKQQGKLGTVYYKDNRYIIEVLRQSSATRKRMTIAHELGHLFFREKGDHILNIVDRAELKAEESICNLLASMLLMPKGYISDMKIRLLAESTQKRTSWYIFKELAKSAKRFDTSIPALVVRLGHTPYEQEPNLILFCTAYFENAYKGGDPRLRIWSNTQLGSLRVCNTWYNKSIESLGLKSVEALFDSWRDSDKKGHHLTGVYTLDKQQDICIAKKDTVNWTNETLTLSFNEDGKWLDRSTSLFSSGCLFAKEGWNENQVYIITAGKVRS